MAVASISMPPVLILSFLLARSTTLPVTSRTNSLRALSAASATSATSVAAVSGLTTIWTIPSRSRKSMKINPPRLRRLATQPLTVTV